MVDGTLRQAQGERKRALSAADIVSLLSNYQGEREKNCLGIWGFGIVGKTATDFLHNAGLRIEVFDQRELSTEEKKMLHDKNISWVSGNNNLQHFLDRHEMILPSPGIDLRPYRAHHHKWISELDLFQAYFQKPIIAITGSIGKTSITNFLSTILQRFEPIATGGNIGTGMLSLLALNTAQALLEVSSFQLALTKSFAPSLAIWTNFYPNHLDRHGSFQEYFDAKYQILARQSAHDKALVPLSHAPEIMDRLPQGQLHFFHHALPTADQVCFIDKHHFCLFYCGDDGLMQYYNGQHTCIMPKAMIPPISFMENWLIICSTLTLLKKPLADFHAIPWEVPEHRFEKIVHRDLEFYNDSKSTTPMSTIAAVEKLVGKPVHLFIGGVGKGIDRSPMIHALKNRVMHIYCFGKEAELLHTICQDQTIESSAHKTLEDAFEHCMKKAEAGDCILFSPAGASFDLFENFKKRGERFKELIFSNYRQQS